MHEERADPGLGRGGVELDFVPAAPPVGAGDVQVWISACAEILEAIADHPAFPSAPDSEAFSREIREIRSMLSAQPAPERAEAASAGVQEVLLRYSKNAENRLGGYAVQLRDITEMFVAYTRVAPTDLSVEDLRLKARKSTGKESLQALRAHVEDRLARLQAHGEQHRRRIMDLAQKLQDRLAIIERFVTLPPPRKPSSESAESIDPCTGLLGWGDAQIAIQQVLESSKGGNAKRPALAIFYVHRMAHHNARLGRAVADKLLLLCSQHLATNLIRPADTLYRGNGPVFIALLDRGADTLAQTESELQRLLSAPINQYLETPSRTVYLQMKMTGHAVPDGKSFSEIMEWIEQYLLNADAENFNAGKQ